MCVLYVLSAGLLSYDKLSWCWEISRDLIQFAAQSTLQEILEIWKTLLVQLPFKMFSYIEPTRLSSGLFPEPVRGLRIKRID